MKIELCVASLDAVRFANELPVDRIQTCIALEQGGLTPSKAMVEWIQDTFNLEQHVLIRLRAGGFVYNYDELLIMRNQLIALKNTGIKGFVVGALTENYELNIEILKIWKSTAPDLDFTFHRAFDSIVNWQEAMDQLINIGFKRILTSGSDQNVLHGMRRLKEYVAYANGRIEIMAGGGVREEVIPEICATGVDAVHFSGTNPIKVELDTAFEETLLLPDLTKMNSLIAAVKSAN